MAITWGDCPRLICSILLPPLGVFFQVGCNKDFAINCLLTLLGYIPGIIHAVYILVKEQGQVANERCYQEYRAPPQPKHLAAVALVACLSTNLPFMTNILMSRSCCFDCVLNFAGRSNLAPSLLLVTAHSPNFLVPIDLHFIKLMDEPLVSGGIILLICLGVTVFMQCSYFAVAFTCQFDKVTNLAGALNFIVLAVLSLVVQGVFDTRAAVVTCMQVAWALRLGAFLLIRVLKQSKDERFDEMRANYLAFFGFGVFQILWVFLVSLPVVLANSCGDQVNDSFGEPRDIVGIVVWAIGVVEYAADASKSAFNDDPKNKGKLLSSGVWKYSRHPNYFGEILCWVGVTITASANFAGNEGDTLFYYVSSTSPMFTFLVLMFLSGVPLAEDRYDERFGMDPNYIEYKRSTSPLIMLPPAVYRAIPDPIKRLCFFELERYSRKLRDSERKVPPTNYQAFA